MMVFHILAKLLCDRRSRARSSRRRLAHSGSSFAAPVVAQFPGDAAAHLGQRVVAELDEVEVIDHDLRVG